MGLEIERKFLLKKLPPTLKSKGVLIKQGYIKNHKASVVRVRRLDNKGFLTIKGETLDGVCPEYEYGIPSQDADQLLDFFCRKPLIEKKRYQIENAGSQWIIDEFYNENKGLIIAEIELDSRDQEFEIPDWVDKEVTGDPKYFNASLIDTPYSKWESV